MTEHDTSILVVGTGSWGTALAIVLGRSTPVTLLCRTEAEADLLRHQGRNERFLPSAPFPELLKLDHDPERACAGSRLVLIVVPSRHVRANARLIAPYLRPDHVVLSAAKGIESGSWLRMTQVLEDEFRQNPSAGLGALSGPNLASEVVVGKPATAVAASSSPSALALALPLLNAPHFRVYSNPDVIGVELGGALKNVIALGAGAVDGLQAGDNAKAAFVTRGLAEMARLGLAAGAQPLTFAGLAGLGDLLATVSSPSSRNRYVGQELARGRSLPQVLRALAPQVAEGVETARAARELAGRFHVEMPITEQTCQVLFEGKDVGQALTDLMFREPRGELEF